MAEITERNKEKVELGNTSLARDDEGEDCDGSEQEVDVADEVAEGFGGGGDGDGGGRAGDLLADKVLGGEGCGLPAADSVEV